MLVTVAILSIREEVSGVVKFLYNKAYTPEDVEVIVRIDEEDSKGQDYIDNISGIHKNVRVIVGKKMWGYCSAPDMHKEIYEEMKGEFLFILNDDITDITKGWDSVIRSFSGTMTLLSTSNDKNIFDFGIYPKKFIEVNGRLQYSCFMNWDLQAWYKYFPELIVCLSQEDLYVAHTPSAGYGGAVSLGLHCEGLHTQPGQYEYPWSRLHLDIDGEVRSSDVQPKGLNKWYKICKVDVPNLKKWLRKNTEWIRSDMPEDWVEVDYAGSLNSGCDCCDEKKVKESGLLRS